MSWKQPVISANAKQIHILENLSWSRVMTLEVTPRTPATAVRCDS